MRLFEFVRQDIATEALKSSLETPVCGAYASFEGWVRNHNQGRSDVQALDYEAYEELGLKEGERIIHEAMEKFEIHKALCVHRLGALKLGDMAVWVGVSAGHREAAFGACRYIIDEVKQRVPIWKKEHYREGDSGWVESEPPRSAGGDQTG